MHFYGRSIISHLMICKSLKDALIRGNGKGWKHVEHEFAPLHSLETRCRKSMFNKLFTLSRRMGWWSRVGMRLDPSFGLFLVAFGFTVHYLISLCSIAAVMEQL